MAKKLKELEIIKFKKTTIVGFPISQVGGTTGNLPPKIAGGILYGTDGSAGLPEGLY
jgi:hypothetical protein